MSKQADELYAIVPALYRNRDTGDLKRFFEGAGGLLDQIQKTLEQKQADNFSDNPLDDSLACQEWLLPYYADLLDVRLVSPTARGKREEISNAVRWRQAKGTLRVVEEIAEALANLEVEVQEGWKRLALTARVNLPKVPATSYGYTQNAPSSPPAMAAKNPFLPAVTPDFRCPSGAVETTTANPAARQTTVDGETSVWRQASYHGAPCHPGHVDDVSQRTVDFRCPDWRVGHYHPDNLLLYYAPPAGFFPDDVIGVNWSEEPTASFLEQIEIISTPGKTIYRNKTLGTHSFKPVRIRKVIKLGQVPDGVGDKDFHTWVFEGVILENTLEADSGRVELHYGAARKIDIHSIDLEQPVFRATNAVIKNITTARGLTELEYCTVLETCLSEVINASDCIFNGIVKKDHPTDKPPEKGCIRYSAVVKNQEQGGVSFSSVVRSKAVFFSDQFSARSAGVLHPATEESIRYGSADGSEMGAYHFLHLSLLPELVKEKLTDYLPLGLEAVLIPDGRLLEIPTP